MKRKLKIVLTAAVLLSGALPAVGAGRTIYVDCDASSGGDGTSWATAFKYLQDALVAADVNDEIRVAQGTYVPDRSSSNPGGSGDREATFRLFSGVGIYGGYAGYGEPDSNDRDIEVYETILSGDLLGNDVVPASPEDLPGEATRSDNCYHVVSSGVMMVFETVALDGLTITAGHANDTEYPKSSGGGVYNEYYNARIVDCIFKYNYALSGGGIYNGYSSPTIEGCTFKDNYAEFGGGGLYCRRLDMVVESLISGSSVPLFQCLSRLG